MNSIYVLVYNCVKYLDSVVIWSKNMKKTINILLVSKFKRFCYH